MGEHGGVNRVFKIDANEVPFVPTRTYIIRARTRFFRLLFIRVIHPGD